MNDRAMTIVQLESGRGGCDAQVAAVADRLGHRIVAPVGTDVTGPVDAVMLTGPDRASCADRFRATHPDAMIVGFGDAGRIGCIDLHVVTPQFDPHPRTPVICIDFAISPHPAMAERNGDGTRPGGYALLLVGGDAWPWSLDDVVIADAARRLAEEHGRVLIMTSRRTPGRIHDMLSAMRSNGIHVDGIDGRLPPMAEAMAHASVVLVTADSVSMASEAVQAGCETALIPLEAEEDALRRHGIALLREPDANPMPGRLDRFWLRYAATGRMDLPRRRYFREPSLDIVVGALKRRMGRVLDQAA